jgi:predicted nucleic acid-binding protein
MGEIGHDEFLACKQRARTLAGIWDSVDPSPWIAARACSLLERYPLRSADALQLAGAIQYFEDSPRGHVFITADRRLADAARGTGFSVQFL